MYTVSVRGHMMVAHSFHGEDFGPAQKLHGATYVVDVEFRKADLNADNILVDIGRAADTLNGILSGLSHRNLDEDPSFEGRNTTTEFLARIVFDRMVAALKRGELGMAARGVEGIKVTLHESHVASASFEDDIT